MLTISIRIFFSIISLFLYWFHFSNSSYQTIIGRYIRFQIQYKTTWGLLQLTSARETPSCPVLSSKHVPQNVRQQNWYERYEMEGPLIAAVFPLWYTSRLFDRSRWRRGCVLVPPRALISWTNISRIRTKKNYAIRTPWPWALS